MVDRWTELSIDLETFSATDLRTRGFYKYRADPEFQIMLMAYCYVHYYYDEEDRLRYDKEETKLIDFMNGDVIPKRVLRDLPDASITKTSHNAPFEIGSLEIHLAEYHPEVVLDLTQWECTMAKAAMLGLPMDLDTLGHALRLSTKKDREGKDLIKYFCVPCKPTKTNGGRTRNYPHHAPEKWARFCFYCITDVDVEILVKQRFAWFRIPKSERRLWALDQEINRRGIRIDQAMAQRAIDWDARFKKQVIREAIEITGLRNPNSLQQLKKWLTEEIKENEEDVEFDEDSPLTKDEVPKLLDRIESDKIKRVLELKQLGSKTSVRKYRKMLQMVLDNGRICGSLQFCGAGRTWRWAGRGIQPHNYPRNLMKYLDVARAVLTTDSLETLGLFKESVPDVLSQLLRTCFVPKPGHVFYVSDYAAIEARVLAWLAGEQWVLDVFKGHGKIYEATASMMFNVPIDEITKDSPWRQRGKVADLACGYQGSVGALIKMKALDYGIKEDELKGLVTAWRQAHPKTVQFWYDIHNAAVEVLTEGGKVELQHGIVIAKKRGHLFIKLPSGRELVYCGAYHDQEDNQIKYWGMNQTSKKWELIKSYGGKFVENIVQAIARDILKEGLFSVSRKYDVVMHIHDEIISEVPIGYGSLREHNKLMCPIIPWAPGLPLKTAGFVGNYYKKD